MRRYIPVHRCCSESRIAAARTVKVSAWTTVTPMRPRDANSPPHHEMHPVYFARQMCTDTRPVESITIKEKVQSIWREEDSTTLWR